MEKTEKNYRIIIFLINKKVVAKNYSEAEKDEFTDKVNEINEMSTNTIGKCICIRKNNRTFFIPWDKVANIQIIEPD